MKISLLTLILIPAFICSLLSAAGQVSQPDSITYSKQLIKIEQQLLDDIPSGNSSNWNKYTATGWFIMTEDGSVVTKKEFLADFRGLPKGYVGHINVIKPKVVFYNSTAVVNYVADEYLQVFDSRIHTTYGTMNTYLRKDTSWQMISSQVYEIPALPPAIRVPVSVLEKYTGIYQLTDSNTCTITVENDTLRIQKKGRGKDALLPETENVFFRKADTRGRKVFLPDEKGNMLMRERRNGQDVIWKQIRKG